MQGGGMILQFLSLFFFKSNLFHFKVILLSLKQRFIFSQGHLVYLISSAFITQKIYLFHIWESFIRFNVASIILWCYTENTQYSFCQRSEAVEKYMQPE